MLVSVVLNLPCLSTIISDPLLLSTGSKSAQPQVVLCDWGELTKTNPDHGGRWWQTLFRVLVSETHPLPHSPCFPLLSCLRIRSLATPTDQLLQLPSLLAAATAILKEHLEVTDNVSILDNLLSHHFWAIKFLLLRAAGKQNDMDDWPCWNFHCRKSLRVSLCNHGDVVCSHDFLLRGYWQEAPQ